MPDCNVYTDELLVTLKIEQLLDRGWAYEHKSHFSLKTTGLFVEILHGAFTVH